MTRSDEHATSAFAVENRCKRYEGSFALVTGAARGLGRVIARRLADEGASVVIADIDESALRVTREDLLRDTGREIESFCGDLSVAGVAQRMVDEMVGRFSRIDLLVNNAAALIRMPLVDMTEELMQAAVDGNVWTTLRCCKAVLPAMLERRYGRIVNIGGEAWRTGAPFHTLLAGVGKGSMVGLTATLAGEVAASGITVNCVSPGGIETEADGRRPGSAGAVRDPSWTPTAVLETMRKRGPASPMGRMAHPTEVAAAVAFLGSREASFVTGQHLGVSGGYVML
jgi:2,3-dihydroxy-2,3-dihydro-p-cumate dehydrogenase